MTEQSMEQPRGALALVAPVIVILVVAALVAVFGIEREREQAPVVAVDSGLKHIGNSLGMTLIAIPGGEFMMGDATHGPQHAVNVRPFYIADREVTQAQWQAVMGYNPSVYPDPRRPVENVSWMEVQSFLENLNRLERTNKYRLPSEAEWEYAARAGSQGRFFFGDDEVQLRNSAWFGANANAGPRPAGSLAPNAWGLHDVYGNVWEWVQECWHPDYNGAPADSRVWGGGDCSLRTLRGGGWNNRPEFLGSTIRGNYRTDDRDASNGFRVARNP